MILDSIFPSRTELVKAVARISACVVVTGGCLAALSGSGSNVGWKLQLAYVYISLGVVCMIEMVWRRIEPEKLDQTESKEVPSSDHSFNWEEVQSIRKQGYVNGWNERDAETNLAKRLLKLDRFKALVELTTVVVLAFLIALLARVMPPQAGLPAERAEGRNLAVCQDELAHARADLGSCKVSLQQQVQTLDLQKKTLSLLQQSSDQEAKTQETANKILSSISESSNKPQPDPRSGWSLGFNVTPGEILLAGLVLIAVVFMGRKHKEAVPVAGAAGLAAEALKHSKELALLDRDMYEWVLWTFIGVSALLTVLFLLAAVLELAARTPARDSKNAAQNSEDTKTSDGLLKKLWRKYFGTPERAAHPKENYISSLGFSIVVLLWALVIVAYKPEENSKHLRTGSELRDSKLTSVQLQPLRPFVEHTSTPSTDAHVDKWKKAIEDAPMNRGDILLLIGSTDCKPFSEGNAGLAQARASAASKLLEADMDAKGVRIAAPELDQHSKCAESNQLRAVFPILIHDDLKFAAPDEARGNGKPPTK